MQLLLPLFYSFLAFRHPLSLVANPPGGASSSSTPTQQHGGLRSKSYNGCTTKVVKADKRVVGGKVEFTSIEAVYVDLKPGTANVNYVLAYIQNLWGSEYVIVSNDGLQIQDSSATKGQFFIIMLDSYRVLCNPCNAIE